MQANVEFIHHTPQIRRSADFAQYHLNKNDLEGLLAAWASSVRWTIKYLVCRSALGEYHPTAWLRTTVPAPIREFLVRHGVAEPSRRVLYHGVGRDEPGARALAARGSVLRFDPFHPDPSIRKRPEGLFHEIHSHYVLNSVDVCIGKAILQEIHALLMQEGLAIITVRRDLDRRRSYSCERGA